MTEEPDFLTVQDVLLLHEEQLARYGGGTGVRDPASLDSAVAVVFLDFNGVVIADPGGSLYQAMIDVAEKRLDKDGLADLLRRLAAANKD